MPTVWAIQFEELSCFFVFKEIPMEFTYRGLKAKLERHTVTETEINHQMERLRKQTPRIAAVTDRPTQNGDEVVLDYIRILQSLHSLPSKKSLTQRMLS